VNEPAKPSAPMTDDRLRQIAHLPEGLRAERLPSIAIAIQELLDEITRLKASEAGLEATVDVLVDDAFALPPRSQS